MNKLQRLGQHLRNGALTPRVNLVIALVVAAVIVAAGFFLIKGIVAGLFASMTASSATLAGNAQLITDPSAFGGQAVVFNAPPGTPPAPSPGGPLTCPAFPAFPDEKCTGWQHTGVTLKNCDDRTDNGYIWEDNPDKKFIGCYFSKSLVIQAAGVEIYSSQIHGTVSTHWENKYSFRGLYLADVEIENCYSATDCTTVNTKPSFSYENAAIGGADFTCVRCNIHNTVTGAHLGDNAIMMDSWLHDFQIEPDTNDENAPLRSHGAGIGEGGNQGNHSRIIHNNISCARLPGQYQQCSSALSLYDEPKLEDVIVKNNLFNAINGYCVYGGGSNGKDIKFIDNHFGKKYNPWCGGQDDEISVAFFYFPNDFVSKNGGEDGGCTFPEATSPRCNRGNEWRGNVWADGSGEALPNRDSKR